MLVKVVINVEVNVEERKEYEEELFVCVEMLRG